MSIERTYTGRAGQRAFLAEVLFRNCNAAIPEVDQGLDTFVFHDDADDAARVQVKTGRAERYRRGEGYSTQFALGVRQLEGRDEPPLFYAFLVHLEDRVSDILIIPRARLQSIRAGTSKFGTVAEGNLVLTVQVRETIRCGDADLTEFRGAWHLLPAFQPASEGTAGADDTA
jgi:hypothetical protein